MLFRVLKAEHKSFSDRNKDWNDAKIGRYICSYTLYLPIPADLFNYKSFQVSQERIWWMTDFSPTIIIFPVKEIVMSVNPQKIDTLLALCSDSDQKAAKILRLLCFLMNFDTSWRCFGYINNLGAQELIDNRIFQKCCNL